MNNSGFHFLFQQNSLEMSDVVNLMSLQSRDWQALETAPEYYTPPDQYNSYRTATSWAANITAGVFESPSLYTTAITRSLAWTCDCIRPDFSSVFFRIRSTLQSSARSYCSFKFGISQICDIYIRWNQRRFTPRSKPPPTPTVWYYYIVYWIAAIH